MGPIQAVAVVEEAAASSGWLDFASLAVGVLVGVGSLLIACLAFTANRRAAQVSSEFHDWQKHQREPFPVVTGLAVRRVQNTVVRSTRDARFGDAKIADGYSVSVSIHNAGVAPLVIQIAKLNFNFGPDGKAGYSAYQRFDMDPLHIAGGHVEQIRFRRERPGDWDHPQWPDSVTLLLVYFLGRGKEGFNKTWNLLETMGPGAPKDTRLADLDRLSEVDVEQEDR